MARDGHEVTPARRGPHLDALRARDAVVVREADGIEWTAPVTARTTAPQGACDLVIVTTKSQHSLQAAQSLESALAPGTTVVSLHNGVDRGAAAPWEAATRVSAAE